MCSLGEVAIWAFHGDADDLVAPAGSIDTITDLTACPQPRHDAELHRLYPGVDHDSWTRTYDESAGHDIYDWLLGYTVTDPAVAESTGPTAIRRARSLRRAWLRQQIRPPRRTSP